MYKAHTYEFFPYAMCHLQNAWASYTSVPWFHPQTASVQYMNMSRYGTLAT